MTEKENFMRVFHHQTPEWTPNFFQAYCPYSSSLINNSGEIMKGGKDMFGIEWICCEESGWQVIPDHKGKRFMQIEDMEHWGDFMKFPDLDAMDWEAAAARDSFMLSPDKMSCYFGMDGNFIRLTSMLGTCEALEAMLEEEDAVEEWFAAYTDFNIKLIDKVATYYKPDIYVTSDDVCTANGLFFSKKLYDRLIKPNEKRLVQAVREHGMIAEHHICGLNDMVLDDMVDNGVQIWQMVQTMNDIPALEKKYGDKLLFHGGWDSTAPYNYTGCTEECVRAGVRESLDKYLGDGHFALFPVCVGDMFSAQIQERRGWIMDECTKYSRELLAR